MSKESDAGSGLLGKVARFIKSPTTDWVDLGRPGAAGLASDFDSPESRLALKEMIERKRRNDFVRRREFDVLRRIRQKSNKGGSEALDTMALTSSYTESQMFAYGPASGEEQKRAQTLQKINEIESQISSSWFRKSGKTAPAPVGSSFARHPPSAASSQPPAARRSRPAPLGGVPAARPRPAGGRNPPPMPTPGYVPSEPPMLTQLYQPETGAGTARRSSAQPVAATPAMPVTRPSAPPPARTVYGNALEDTLEVATLRQDPEVEEAAISFANGDPAAAESALLRLVSQGGSRRDDVEVWLTLFDLYRITNKTDSFDGLVPEFTALFGRSAPQWERAQGSSNDIAPSARTPALQTTREGAFAWTCPAQLNARALTALTGAVKRTAPPWRIDWRPLKAVEPDVLAPLHDLFTQWADTPTQLQFLGDAHVLSVLAERSPTGDKNADPAWWNARLALLRLMGAPDPFDQTALDYCITYEISPPAWTPSQSAYTSLTGDGQSPQAFAPPTTRAPIDFAPTTITGELMASTGVFKATLEGEILDSASQALAVLPKNMARIQAIDFDCSALRRVDFGAAGDFLNWSIDQQSQGRTITFRGAHRLLAAFLSVIGVNTVARVVLRKD